MNDVDKASRASNGVPRVSVITIFFNAEDYLTEAIDSVLAQNSDDFELILVDDGSTDGSSEIARRYAECHPERVTYRQHPDGSNRGMSAARNLGLVNARGDFVAFIDADDRWRPYKLREQVELLDRLQAVDAVGGAVNYWASHSGGKDRLVPTAHVRNRPIAPGEATARLYPLGKANAPSMSDLMFRRASIDAVGGFEEAFSGAYEDQAFLSKFYLTSTLHVTNSEWSDYRLHDQSCMAKVRRNGAYKEELAGFLNWFANYLAESGRDDPRIRKSLARALRRARRRDLRSWLSKTPVGAVVRSGKSALRRMRPILAPGPGILMYHRIAQETFDPWELTVSPQNFEAQLRWIARNRTILPLGEFAEMHRQGKLPRNAIALTFDDGYACNVRTAVPLLERLGVPATIFLSTELIESGEEFWWDELQSLVLQHEGRTFSVGNREIHLGERLADDLDWPPATPPRTSRQLAYRQIWSILYAMAPVDQARAMRNLREQFDGHGEHRETHRPMSREEIRATPGVIEFGSHAVSHASLPTLDRKAKQREISESVEGLTAISGVRPACFAYPYGDFDRESKEMVKAAGFACGCRADGGFVTAKSRTFALPRILVGNWTSAELARRLGRP